MVASGTTAGSIPEPSTSIQLPADLLPHVKQARVSDWSTSYVRKLLMSDVVVVVWAVATAQLLYFGASASNVSVKAFGSVPYWVVSVLLSFAWICALALSDSRHYRVLGTGIDEYRKVTNATLICFGLVAIVALVFKIDFARGYLLIALPLGLVGLLLERKIWRSWLVTQRTRLGKMSRRVVVAGTGPRVSRVICELTKSPAAGYAVVGAALPAGDKLDDDVCGGQVPVGLISDAVDFMRSVGGDTIAVSGGEAVPGPEIQRISWQLVPGQEHLIVSPALIDIAGPRIGIRPVAGLSLIHVETPKLSGVAQLTKTAFDRLGSLLLIILLSPLFAVTAIAIKLDSRGPIFFVQDRVGLHGQIFRMFKFRSMSTDAEARLKDLADKQRDRGNVVMFKMTDDPRITRVGKLLRRYSIDELPQLINVLLGTMSLVGPRPPLQREVELYGDHVHRRFLVRPGITGLWQVSGRSDLDWDETVRLDLYYVANWSLTQDLQIISRTLRAVVGKDGAY
ncbi:sugar transferase [Rarobacter incanus]|uniref:Undecaprenyl-phosphate galactose phosphotransferase WbaP/exopolysaccharide biosynthesis polyprenyl glycosylphosphotransferase n=1 Tax=Rarobacter incanus TaxID=153494 RepID=A0A542SM97_9MICO|nr:sugar transferase [Rarobacter incanus]TQK75743.1 Undecaprenyl-phosphate galactose phosphotransferase WbaP/exopolysaccharide biosynthesis polyprenyl glycosylphosphotransferase [Rarobacter incanus]